MDERQFDEFEQKLKALDEHNHPAMNDCAWSKMEAKLDEAFVEKKKRRGLLWFFMLLGIIAGGGIIFYLTGGRNHSTEQAGQTAIANVKVETASANQTRIATKTEQPVSEKSVTTGKKTQNASTGKQQESDKKPVVILLRKPTSYQLKSDSAIHARTTKDVAKASPKKTLKDANQLQGIAVSNGVIKRPLKDNNLQNHTALLTANNRLSVELINGKLFYPTLTIPAPDSATALSIKSINDLTDSITKTAITKQKTRGRFFIGPTLINSFSGVHLNQASANTAFGIEVGYSLNKWSVSTGINAGHLLYSASGENYNPVKSPNLYGYKLKSVYANCYVLEIPLSVAYQFYKKRSLTLFASAGVLSQIMKRETYQYVATKYDSVWANTWKYANENQHLFSMLQLGIGINYQINNKIAFSATPFYKIPFEGIGHGRIKLYTAGLALSMHYFPFNRPRKK